MVSPATEGRVLYSDLFPSDKDDECCFAVSARNTALLAEEEFVSCNDGSIGKACGLGCALRAQSTAKAINTLAFAEGCGALLCAGAGVCLACGIWAIPATIYNFILCREKDATEGAHCTATCCDVGGSAIALGSCLMINGLFQAVTLPCGMLCPEALYKAGGSRAEAWMDKQTKNFSQAIKEHLGSSS